MCFDFKPALFVFDAARPNRPRLADWAWPGVAYASSTGGDLRFTGAADEDVYGCFGCGDGYGIIEPDKLGELGLQMLVRAREAWRGRGRRHGGPTQCPLAD